MSKPSQSDTIAIVDTNESQILFRLKYQNYLDVSFRPNLGILQTKLNDKENHLKIKSDIFQLW